MQKPTISQRVKQAHEQGTPLVLDGAMGTLIIAEKLTEEDFRGTEFADWPVLLKGNNDLLVLTRPDLIQNIHRQYLEAGADLISTCTFSSQRVSQAEYQLGDYAERMCRAGARLARAEADRMTALTPDQPRYVLGDVGPTSRMLSMSEDVNDPAARSITFDELADAFAQQMRWLTEEGVDAILVETIFDTLNAKAAIEAHKRLERPVPLMLSMTVSDNSGRTLSGQTVEAFCATVAYAKPLSIGMNCGMGPEGMIPLIRRMKQCMPGCYISCHPNAGLPNQMGEYDVTPQDMVRQMQPLFIEHLADIVGGCCGTTPEHIRAMVAAPPQPSPSGREQNDVYPSPEGGKSEALEERLNVATSSDLGRPVPWSTEEREGALTGLDSFTFSPDDFIVVGERCNVAGSRKFLRLINEKQYDEALSIARRQVEQGAMVVDLNMDDGLLDTQEEICHFLRLMASDPAIARVPVMIDSSRFEVIEAALKCWQGKAIVNSISLKQGEEEFLRHARTVHRMGAAVVVMCFDEEGQATDYERRIRICERAYRLLTQEVGMDATDIIFDPNILTIATGMAEHANYALDFIRATEWVRQHLPGARVSGGLSNLSFAFRGNNPLREAMHAVFLHHARQAGMGMAIMNPATAVRYEDIDPDLRKALSDTILNTDPEAADRLTALAATLVPQAAKPKAPDNSSSAPLSATERLVNALLQGESTTLEPDIQQLLGEGRTPLEIISGPLMQGMNEVGRLFGEGKMFLPQVVKTARTMKRATEILFEAPTAPPQPSPSGREQNDVYPSPEGGKSEALEERLNVATSSDLGRPVPWSTEEREGASAILLATVKGDVHDIGKNIVGVVLACNGFRVVDLGVMVPCETIVQEAINQQVDIVCLSGLITPSLDEMCRVAEAMQAGGLRIPLFVGGATTSAIHTAVKIAPLYEGGVFHMRDAAQDPVVASQLLDPAQHDAVFQQNLLEQQRIRLAVRQRDIRRQEAERRVLAEGVPSPEERRFAYDWSKYIPISAPFLGKQVHQPIPVADLLPLIDWTYFYWAWRVKEQSQEGRLLRQDAEQLLQEMAWQPDYALLATWAFYPAQSHDTTIDIAVPHSTSPLPIPPRGEGVDSSVALGIKPSPSGCPCCGGRVNRVALHTPRQSSVKASGEAREQCLALADFISPLGGDHIGAFATTISDALRQRIAALKESGQDDYTMLLLQTLADRLAEAAAEYLSRQLQEHHQWGGIRPAIGYPSLPDQRSIFQLAQLIDFPAIGITLTENGAMSPASSVAGLLIGHPEATYFRID